jgi:hypothetical protein
MKNSDFDISTKKFKRKKQLKNSKRENNKHFG